MGESQCGTFHKKDKTLSGDEEYVIFEESSNWRQGTQGLFHPPFKMERGNKLDLAGGEARHVSVGEPPTPAVHIY